MADTNRGLNSADEQMRQHVTREGGEARKDQGADYSEMGRKGGEAAHEKDTAHEFSSEEARETDNTGNSK